MQHLTRPLCLAAIGFAMMIATISEANAQYPVYGVQPVAPAVVGYAAQRRGLFGRRVVLRPVVAPVAVAPVAVAPVAVARPVVPAPVASYYPPAAPVASYYPPVAPVTSYYAPAAPVTIPAPLPVPVPVTTFRVPISTYVPVIAF